MAMEVNDLNFEKEVIQCSKTKPVIVDFYASWCMPCRMFSPAFEKVEEQLKSKLNFAKLNVDENPLTTQNFDVMSVPTVKLFWQGRVSSEFSGAKTENQLKNWIMENI